MKELEQAKALLEPALRSEVIAPAAAREALASLAAAEERVRDLRQRAKTAMNEIRALAAFERDVRAVIGNTNWACLTVAADRIDAELGEAGK